MTMALHILDSNNLQTFNRCVRCAVANDSLLLIDDGCYLGCDQTLPTTLNYFKVFALITDVQARGLVEKINGAIRQIDYVGFVDLTAEHDKIISWSYP